MTRLTLGTLVSVASVLSLGSAASAGAWVDTSSTSINRTPVGGGVYQVDFTFRVKRHSIPFGTATTRKIQVDVVEIDPCFDDRIFSAPMCINIPASGTTGPVQTLTFFYPCSWGDDIGVSVSNAPGFTGAKVEAIDLPLGSVADECGPGARSGGLTLTPDVENDELLRDFFGQTQANPVIPVTRGFDGTTGEELLGFTLEVLPDPAPLGYTGYELTVWNGGNPVIQLPVPAAGSTGDPDPIPDSERHFGPPTRHMAVPIQLMDLSLQSVGTIDMVDAGGRLGSIPVYQGLIDPAPDYVMARRGTLNTGSGPAYDSLYVNYSRGDEFRFVVVDRFEPLEISFDATPGTPQQFDYALYALLRENRGADLTPHPFGLGTACFSTPLTGGGATTVLNGLGFEHLLGVPLVSSAGPGPGVALTARRARGFPPIDVTLQAIVPDCKSPNGRAGLSNAIVVKFR